jgi:hypothetical protein
MGLMLKRATEESPRKIRKKITSRGNVLTFQRKKKVSRIEDDDDDDSRKNVATKIRAKKTAGKKVAQRVYAQPPAEVTKKVAQAIFAAEQAKKMLQEAKDEYTSKLATLGEMIAPSKSFRHPTKKQEFSVMSRKLATGEVTWFIRPKPTGASPKK